MQRAHSLLCSCAADKPATGYNLVPAVTLYALTTDKPLRVAFNFCGPFEVSTTITMSLQLQHRGLTLGMNSTLWMALSHMGYRRTSQHTTVTMKMVLIMTTKVRVWSQEMAKATSSCVQVVRSLKYCVSV